MLWSRSLCALCVLLLVSGHAVAQPAPQQKLATTTTALQQKKREEVALARELATTRNELARLRARVTGLAKTLQQSEVRASTSEQKLAVIARDLAAKETEFATRKQEYVRTVAALLRMHTLPPTALFASEKSAADMVRASQVLQHTNRALAARADALKTDMQRITALRRDMRTRTHAVSREQAALQKQQQQLAAELTARQRLQEKLADAHRTTQAQVATLSRESASLQELIGKLESARNAPALAGKVPPVPPTRIATPRRGGMQLPVVGSLLHRFGERKNANETYRGVVLTARSGASVVAPAAGEVVFTGPFLNYGRMVLLKHGDGMISLLAGLGSISVGLNQSLAKGEPIGSMGGSAQLYIEVRERSKPIDPAGWFANLPQRVSSR